MTQDRVRERGEYLNLSILVTGLGMNECVSAHTIPHYQSRIRFGFSNFMPMLIAFSCFSARFDSLMAKRTNRQASRVAADSLANRTAK